MKWNELLKKLKKAGYVYLRDAKGSHEYWHHPDREGSEEVIANKILKRAGLK